MHRYPKGVSLVELSIVLTILSVVIAISIPSLNHFLINNRLTTSLNQVVRAIHMAREAAIFRNQVVTLCPSPDGLSCKGDWHSGILLFVDPNQDRLLSDEEEIVYYFNSVSNGDKLYWRAFRARSYLQMRPGGFTAWQNGTFTLCPAEGLRYARGIILNSAGRIRLTQDKNNDGIHEGASGRSLRCE